MKLDFTAMASGMSDTNSEVSCFLERVEINILNMKSEPSNGFSFIGHVKDQYTNFNVLFPLKDNSPKEIALCLKKHFISYFGPPVSFVSDLKQSFLSKVLCEVLGSWKAGRLSFMISDRKGDPRSQKSLIVAKFIQDNIALMAAELGSGYSLWSDWLPEIMLRLNVCRHTSRHLTPYTALFKQEASRSSLAEPQDLYTTSDARGADLEEMCKTKEHLRDQGGHDQLKQDTFPNTSDGDGILGFNKVNPEHKHPTSDTTMTLGDADVDSTLLDILNVNQELYEQAEHCNYEEQDTCQHVQRTSGKNGIFDVIKASSDSKHSTSATSVIDNTAADAALQDLMKVKQELYDPVYELSNISSSALPSELNEVTNLPTETQADHKGSLFSSFVKQKEKVSINDDENNRVLSVKRKYDHPVFSDDTVGNSQIQSSHDELKCSDMMDGCARVRLQLDDVPLMEASSDSTYRMNTNNYSVTSTTLPVDSVYAAEGSCVQLVEAKLNPSNSVTNRIRNDFPVINAHSNTADGCCVPDADKTSAHHSSSSTPTVLHDSDQGVPQAGQGVDCQSNDVSNADVQSAPLVGQKFYRQSSGISAAEKDEMEVTSKSAISAADIVSNQTKAYSENQTLSNQEDSGESIHENMYTQPSIEIDNAEDGEDVLVIDDTSSVTDGNASAGSFRPNENEERPKNLKAEQPVVNMEKTNVCEKGTSLFCANVNIRHLQELTDKHKAVQPSTTVFNPYCRSMVGSPHQTEQQDLPVFPSILPTESEPDPTKNRTVFQFADVDFLKRLLYIQPMLKVDEIRKRLQTDRGLTVSSHDLIQKIASLTNLIQESASNLKEKKAVFLAASEVSTSELGMLVERNLKSKRRSYVVKVDMKTGGKAYSKNETSRINMGSSKMLSQGEHVDKNDISSSQRENPLSGENAHLSWIDTGPLQTQSTHAPQLTGINVQSDSESSPNPTKRSSEEMIVIDLTDSPSPQEEITPPFKRPCQTGFISDVVTRNSKHYNC